jgi:glyoxylase-like metal-dependent hydrolase (beta-lactamase superfamily II)
MIHRLSVGPIGENVYIAEQSSGPLVVFDPGDEPDRVLAETLAILDTSGAPGVLVAATHGHLDHVSAWAGLVDGLRARGIPVRTYAPEGDRGYFGSRAMATNKRIFADINAQSYFAKHWIPVPEADEYFGDGFLLPGTGIQVIHTPGHTPGSSCFIVDGGSAIIAGDTLFEGGRGRTDTFDADESAIMRSIRERLCALPDAVRVWPGHGEPTTIGREKRLYL